MIRPRHNTIAWTMLVAILLTVGCDKPPEDVPTPGPIRFESQKAPYALELDGEWVRETPETLNAFADLAASYKGTLYLIVIPQKLPDIPGVEPPNALALRRASVAVMEEQIAEFQIARQGPVRLAGTTAQTVFARGVVDKAPVKYVTTYATHQGWGFQIVAWGPADREKRLVSEIDRVLATWRFTDSKPAPSHDIPIPDTDTE